MPSLSELTDYTPPVRQPYAGPRLVVTPASVAPDTDQLPVDTRPEPLPEPNQPSTVSSSVNNILNSLFRDDDKRYQLWPEKVVRSGLGAAGDVLSGNVPQWAVDNDTGDVHTSPQMIEKAQDIAALAGTGGLAGTTDATLGAGPFLRPALKYEGKIYKAPIKDAENPLGFGAEHSDALPTHLADDFYKKAMSGEDINHYNFGFVNHKGQFLNRSKALDYGINEGLVDPSNGKYGVLTSTMLADSSKPGMAIESLAKAEPFYSAVEHNVNNISQSKMNGDQWLATLSNKPGVKPEELQWTGLKDFLEENKGKPVTKEQVQEHLVNNKVELKEVDKGGSSPKKPILDDYISAQESIERDHPDLHPESVGYQNLVETYAQDIATGYHNPTKYHSYQLPGAENYREKLLTLPEKQLYNPEFKDVAKNLQQKLIEKYGSVDKIPTHELENLRVARDVDELNHSKSNQYKSSHWDEPNILAHVRMNDRMIDGKKSLHLEEIQSDWHQQGRDKGYATGPIPKATGWENTGPIGSGNPVPDAPFKKSWHELALKRMIREAAEKGYDRLSWTPGEAQAARYNLSKTADEIGATKNPDGTYHIEVMVKGGGVHPIPNVKPDKLADYVGKGLADKILKQEGKAEIYDGNDLKIGGEGMKGFYDQIIPKSLEKISGQKVKTTNLPYPKLNNKIGEPPIEQPVHYIDIPQELKEKALSRGFPLFSANFPAYQFVPVQGNPFDAQNEK